MEVFLAKQHRIVLKDRAADDFPTDPTEFIEEPDPETESPAQPTETEFDPTEDTLPSMFEEEAGENHFLDDTFEEEQAEEEKDELNEELDETPDEESYEELDENPEQSPEYSLEDDTAEEDEESGNIEDEVLVFGPWDDQHKLEEEFESAEEENADFEETVEESPIEDQEEIQENKESSFMAWAKDKWRDSDNDTDVSVDEAEDPEEEHDDTEEPDLDEWKPETELIEEPEDSLVEEEDGDLVAEFDVEEVPEQESSTELDSEEAQEAESDTRWTPLPPREGFSKSLNPGGYSMHKFSVDHVLPSLSSKDQESQSNEEPETEETPAEVQTPEPVVETEELLLKESPAAQPEETPRVFNDLHSSLHKSIRKLNQLEPDDASENEPEIETGESTELTTDIPVLSPDVVASENIPTGMPGESMAWLQSVPGPAHPDENSILPEDYTGAEDKAQIMSNLSALEDEESLAPLEPEHLEAIDDEPVELHTATDSLRHWKTAARLLTCLILLVGLAGQYVMYNLDSLLIDRRYDSITNLVCQLTECPDNQVIDLTSLVTEELDVRSHPSAESALLVNFIFRNEAPREQRFPLVELNFTDISGDVVANRVFTREEYLPSEMALFTHMPAHSSIQVSLELVDPGSEATGYSLVFRNP